MNTLTSTMVDVPLPWGIRPKLALLDRISIGRILLTTPEGQTLVLGRGHEPSVKVQIASWDVLNRVFRHGDIGLAEAYRDGDLQTDQLPALIRLGIENQALLQQAIHGNRWLNFGYRLRHWMRPNSRRGSQQNIEAHYDLGNDFYSLWLDASMTYSSARFDLAQSDDMTLAQDAKYQRMLDMVGARTGDQVLEIGCGWGGFAEYAARQGVRVHGITLSPSQLRFARERIEAAGLSHLASFALCDYRDIQGKFQHIVSIEMLEAVGQQYWTTYFKCLNALLAPGGKVAIQTIVIDDAHFEHYRQGTDFIQQYIFPGGMLPCPSKLSQLAERHQFELQTSEAFGLDYAETLRRWRGDFDAQQTQVMAQGFDQKFLRLWRFYLAYCEAGFDAGRIDVVQIQLEKQSEV